MSAPPQNSDRQSEGPQPAEPAKRFYRSAVISDDSPHADVLLDGRPVRTPAREVLRAPRAVAEAIAAEWNSQETHILPDTMPLTRLTNTAIDGVASAMDPVKDDIVAIACSDLLSYRATGPAGLVERQAILWDPIIESTQRCFGVPIAITSGIMPIAQDPSLKLSVRKALPDDPLALAALHQLTTLTGSAFIALAIARRSLMFDDGWIAAHVDEDWNIKEWGEDAEAAERRAKRMRDASAASFILENS